MRKIFIFLGLFSGYAAYSYLVYTKGTESELVLRGIQQQQIELGKSLYQQHNCTACHQLYGLGGYLGPELTTAWSDPSRGENYIRAFLQKGGQRMPDFHFTKNETDAIVAFLRYVDSTAITYKKP